MNITMERPVEVTNELSHSCIPGVCPNPCPYTSQADVDLAPVLVTV